MTTIEKQIAMKDKVLIGLKIAYSRLLDFKKMKNSELVIMRDNKIMKIKPSDFGKKGINK